ncbi:HDOD domain-containing protein [bacterium]|nr:HDOD domain-containing protein [bacterium]
MKRVLFVDDEQRVLDGLARMLRPLHKEWNISFAQSGAEGLEMLAAEPIDIVVTDMRMPGMDGAEFLAQVMRRWPDTIRVVLSGHAELEAALRAVPVAHQFIQKPADSETIRDTVRRILAVRETMTSEKLRSTIGGVGSLPAQPKIYTRLLSVLAKAEYTNDEITHLLEEDVALAAKVMQVTNSAFFGRPRAVANLRQAVCTLGSSLLRNVVLASELGQSLSKDRSIPPRLLAAQQKHSQTSAAIAHRIMKGMSIAEDAFTATLLHDIGILIVGGHYRQWMRDAVDLAKRTERPFHVAEREGNPVTHAEAGAYLLTLWGLPMPIVEAVAWHHDPKAAGSKQMDILTAVHVADVLAQEVAPDHRPFPELPCPTLDLEYLESIGVGDRVGQWREQAAEAVAAQTEAKANV